MNLQDALKRMPAPGAGCHPYLMTCANLAIREGYEEDIAVRMIHASIPEGNRQVSEREVRDTVRKVMSEHMNGKLNLPRHGVQLKSLRMTTTKMLDKFLHPDKISLGDLLAASPIEFDPKDPRQQACETLRHLYEPEEKIFIGPAMSNGDNQIYTRDQWITALRDGDVDMYPEHIIWNPLTGRHAKTADGKDSLRCDNAVAAFKYTIVEFDSIDIDTQLRFWAGCKLPVCALVYSGSKSIHGILKVSRISTLDDWRHQIQKLLYQRWLAPLGVDRACSNASRLSRLPGAWREKKEAFQKLLYLNPNGTPIQINK